MKKLLLFLLCLTVLPAFAIDVHTQISWNSAVVEAALAYGGIRRDSDSKLFFRILEDLLQRDMFSISDAVYVCKQHCLELQTENTCRLACDSFGNALVEQNNRAANDPYRTKEKCERDSSLIWVEYYNVCAPKALCSQSSLIGGLVTDRLKLVNYQSWCIEDFSSTQVRGVKYAEDLASSYLKNMLGNTISVNCHVDIPEAGDKKSFGGDNYIPCITGDGRYFVFEFDDTTEKFAGTPKYAFQALCRSFRGRVSGSGDVCMGLTQQQCEKIDEQLDYSFVGDDDTDYNAVTGVCKWD